MKLKSLLGTVGISIPLALGLASCGGGPTLTGAESNTTTLGGVTLAIVGTAQAPVVSASYGAAVVGLAGATISDMSQAYVSDNLGNTRIAFYSNRDGVDEIYTSDQYGNNVLRLTNDGFSDYYPSYNKQGSKVAFASFRGNYDIWSVNADGTNQIQLTNVIGDDNYPSWSPDGTKIAFSSFRDGNGEIYVMNADGTGQTRLTNNTSYDFYPTWSPDGSKIAFVATRDGNYEIYTMAANGTGQTRLTNNAAFDGGPSWSPDGNKIAFQSYRDGNGEIYVMNTNGTIQTRITTNTFIDDTPSWSPDSKKLSFYTDRDGNAEIYTMNADGSGVQRMTNVITYDQYSSWSGFYKPKFVGSGGLLATDCAGFLGGYQGQISKSLVIFDTTTLASRSAARVTANTNSDTNSPNLIFTITTSAGLSSIKFMNITDSLIPVVPTVPAGSTGALVLFDSSTGFVSQVIPYAANRTATHSTKNAKEITFEGQFLGLINDKGINTAPNGATSITVDESTGKVIRFQ